MSMITCTGCSKKINAAKIKPGGRFKCPSCKTILTAPAGDGAKSKPKAPKPETKATQAVSKSKSSAGLPKKKGGSVVISPDAQKELDSVFIRTKEKASDFQKTTTQAPGGGQALMAFLLSCVALLLAAGALVYVLFLQESSLKGTVRDHGESLDAQVRTLNELSSRISALEEKLPSNPAE